ncbi:MAG: hypothetical protein ACT4PY_14840 [Armatimonadota bacterium]
MLRRAGLCILALLVAISPATAAGEFVIIAPSGVTPAVHRMVHQAAERCIPLYAGYLRTRLAAQIEIHIFPTRAAFVRGRQTIAGETPEVAQRAADYLGSAIGYAVMINQATHEGTASGELAGTTCHEILHVYQFELITEDGRESHEWMLEGYAYFMEKIALEHLGFETLPAARERAIRMLKVRPFEIRTAAIGLLAGGLFKTAAASGGARLFPRLAEMTTSDQFNNVGAQLGIAFPHYLFLMMDFLHGATSHTHFVTYFRSFAPDRGAPTADDNFRAAFGMALTDFQLRVDAHIAGLLR